MDAEKIPGGGAAVLRKYKAAIRSIAVLFVMLAFLAPGAVVYAGEGFTTQSYSFTMEVAEDNSFAVTEVFSVDFYEARHGLYTYIPYRGETKYQDANGEIVTQRTNMKIDDVQVAGREFEVYREKGNVVIKIGDPDTVVIGPQVYTITYRCRLYDDGNAEYDSLYWEVAPSTWPSAIETADITILMPKEFSADTVEFLAGAYGSAGGKAVDWQVSGNMITAQVGGLAAYEGVNCRIVLPEGYFVGEMTDDWAYALLLALILLPPLLSLLLWFFLGRDPKVVRTVEFYPPPGISPAEAGFIIDGVVDQKDLVSMVIYFADRGYLRIEERKEGHFTLVKAADLPEDAKRYERTLFDGLFRFGERPEVDLDELGEDFGSAYTAAMDQLKAYFTKTKENRVFTHSSLGARAVSLLLMLTPSLAVIVCGFILTMGSALVALPALGAALALVGYVLLINAFDKRYAMKRAGVTALRVIGALFAVFGLAATAGFALVVLESPAAAVLSAAASLLSFFCAMLMKQRTKKSAALLGKLLGFKEFIRTAELPRIERLVEENPSYFYETLPYAYVFGLTDQWARKFESLPTRPPAWYHSAYMDPYFNTWVFFHTFHHCTTALSSHMRVAVPEANTGGGSGFGGGFGSGGGFVGGGFGGGRGGGSW